MRSVRASWLRLSSPSRLAPVHARGRRRRPSGLPCFSYGEVARQLKGTYQEAPVSLGLQANGNLLQVFSSRQERQLDHRQHLARRHGLHPGGRPQLGET